ncbi:MAG: NUDIX hydrolase [Proteobacteria bacterium]|nr:NUDIX hydrolase [Pseudomonadota bacterium]
MAYRNPTPTVDILILRGNSLVLIKRRNPPHGWAIPGGFVDEGECIEHAAIREAKEETGLDVTLDRLFYVYSNPSRDPRQHTMSTVFIAHADGEPQGDDDAEKAQYFDLDALPDPIAFDHAKIIADYREYVRSGRQLELERATGKRD